MNKRVFTIFIALFLAAFVPKAWGQDVWDGTTVTQVTPVDNVYTITTGAELAWVAQQTNLEADADNFSGKTINLAANINLNEKKWEPIGNGKTPSGSNTLTFKGTFDGCGFTISGLNVNMESGSAGLFGTMNGIVKNLAVTGTTGVTGKLSAGGIAGSNSGTIENCYTNVPVTSTDGYTGGIVGNNTKSIQNCYATGAVTSTAKYAGGIAGNNASGDALIQYCYATGAITGNKAGGIIGNLPSGKVEYCIALNSGITGRGNSPSIGRVVGFIDRGTLTANYAAPTIPGTWSNTGAAAKDGDNLTEANFITSNTAFTGWTSWELDANNFTNLPKLMTTGFTPNIPLVGQADHARATFMPLKISGTVTYDATKHEDKSILIAADGLLTVDVDNAQVGSLEIQQGGQVKTTKKLTVTGKITTKRTLATKWITFGTPAAMEVTGSKLYAKTGYSAEGNQAWTTATGNAGTTLTLAAAPYIVAAETEEKDLAFTTTTTSPIELPAVPTTPDNGNALNNGIFLFWTNSALCNQTLTNVYILNADGTRFELQSSYDVKPFECYLVANPVTQASVQSLRVAGSGTPTGNEPALPTDAFRLWAADGQLHLEASQPADVQIYTLAGALSHSFRLDGSRTITLPRGIYLVRSNNITYKVSL